jgi:parallel beta-helix repeat protein
MALAPVEYAQSSSTIYVDPQIDTAVSTSYDPLSRLCGSGTATAYRSLADVLSAAAAGTTVLIRGGSYNDQLSPVKSGTPDDPVIFKSIAGDQVFLNASPAINLLNCSYIVIDGLRAEGTTWLEARNSDHNVLQNCVFKRTPASGTTGNVRFVQSHYNKILNNSIEEGNDNLLLIDANFNVVQGNTILQGRHSLLGIRCGDNNVIRGNYFANSLQKICEVYDCGADTTAVPNSFNSTKQNLIENNVFADASSYYSSSGGNGIQYSGQQGIIRRNVFYRCNIGVAMQVYGGEAQYTLANHVQHNVFYDNDGAGISANGSAENNTFTNNVLFSNKGTLPDCFGLSPGQLCYSGVSPGTGSLFQSNDFFYQSAGQPVIEQVWSSGLTISQAGTAFPGMFENTLEADPRFVDAPNHDFHLRPDSPLRDAGAWLTKTVGAGSGTTLAVENAGMFYDGFGIPGESGDLIQLAGQNQNARVIQINYFNNTITVARELTWSSGQAISLAYEGTAPDVGAFEYSSQTIIPPAGIEAWRILKFEGAAGNPAIAGDSADPDGDGVNNLLEYGLHGEPKVADTSILPKLGTAEEELNIVFPWDETLTDLTYAVEAADTLTSATLWMTIARGSSGASFVALLPGVKILEAGAGPLKTVTVCDAPATHESGHRFLRLRISR